GELEKELDLARDALDAAHELVRGVEAEVVSPLALRERERVGQSHAAGLRGERGLEHERARQVATLARELACGADRPVAGCRIENSAEHGRAVVAGEAK